MTFANRLVAAREMRGLSQRQLGLRCNILQGHVSAWECGRCKPGCDSLASLACALKVRPDYLLGFESSLQRARLDVGGVA